MVEDEESITEPLAEALEREGFDTRVAGTVAAALEAARAQTARPRAARRDAARRLRARRLPRAAARLGGADHHAHRARRGDRPRGRPRARRRRLRRQAVQRPRGGGAHPRGAARSAEAPARGRAARPLEVGELRLDPSRRSVTLAGAELDLTRKEFELLELLLSEAGSVVTRERLIDEVWDMNWFGSTKTLDVHVSSLRRKLGDDSGRPALHPHGPRRRLPLRGPGRAGTVGREPARAAARRVRLRAGAGDRGAGGAAGAQPLAPGRRRDQERGRRARRHRSRPPSRAASAIGASSAGSLQRAGRDLGGRVIVVGPRGRAARRLGRTRPRGSLLREPPGDRQGAARQADQGTRHSDTLDEDVLFTAVPVVRGRTDRGRGPGDPERGRGADARCGTTCWR